MFQVWLMSLQKRPWCAEFIVLGNRFPEQGLETTTLYFPLDDKIWTQHELAMKVAEGGHMLSWSHFRVQAFTPVNATLTVFEGEMINVAQLQACHPVSLVTVSHSTRGAKLSTE